MSAVPASKVSLKGIALPVQHGGWGFWLEPSLLGLLIAPSWAGIGISLGGLALLLLHQPTRIYIKDVRKGKFYTRTRLARRFMVGYGAMGASALLLALTQAPTLEWLIPPLFAVPLGILQLREELHNEGRSLLSELAGATLFSVLVSAIVLIGGQSFLLAIALWALVTFRAIVSVLYVRARLRLEQQKAVAVYPPILAHIGTSGFIALGAVMGVTPWTALLGMLILTIRAVWGLSSYRSPQTAKAIGFREIAYGLLYVLLIALG